MPAGSINKQQRQQAGFVPACLLCALLLTANAVAQQDTTSKQASDSTHRPLRELGRLVIGANHVDVDLTKERIRTLEYRGLSEVMIRSSGGFPRSLGGFGQHNSVTFYGEDPAAHAISLQGRELYDPWSQRFHLDQWSVDGLERIEILHGTDALGLGAGMALH
ncbi:MAG: hypothetical protein FGM24_10375, partial [Candidatus Kapabacteria bacterium]|nr:hypothetical protein [Candidatus Kapabacteria bacterium]